MIEARVEAGITQAQLAKAVGLKQPDISKIENSERGIDVLEFLDILTFIVKNNKASGAVRELLLSILGKAKLL